MARAYRYLFLMILLRTLISLPADNTTKAKTNVKSATLEPNRVPKPKAGTPSIAELIEIKASGKTEIIATIKKPIMYLDNLKLSANLTENLIAKSAPLVTNTKEKNKQNK